MDSLHNKEGEQLHYWPRHAIEPTVPRWPTSEWLGEHLKQNSRGVRVSWEVLEAQFSGIR